MVTAVMPRGLTGPFATAKAGPGTLAQPLGVQSSGAQGASLSAALSGASGSVAVLSKRRNGGDPSAAYIDTARASLVSSGVRPAATSSRGARQGSASDPPKGASRPPPSGGNVGPAPPGGQDPADDPHPAAMP